MIKHHKKCPSCGNLNNFYYKLDEYHKCSVCEKPYTELEIDLFNKNAKLIEVLKELMQSSEDWNVEDWIEAKKKARNLLAEVKGE